MQPAHLIIREAARMNGIVNADRDSSALLASCVIFRYHEAEFPIQIVTDALIAVSIRSRSQPFCCFKVNAGLLCRVAENADQAVISEDLLQSRINLFRTYPRNRFHETGISMRSLPIQKQDKALGSILMQW